MKKINECFENTRSIREVIEEGQIDEGLGQIWTKAKQLFGKVYKYLSHVVAKIGTYFVPVDEDGKIIPAITSMTAAQAYQEGLTGKDTTFVALGKESSKIQGLKNKVTDAAAALYGQYMNNSLKYYNDCFKSGSAQESYEGNENMINEVKLASEDPEARYSKIFDDDELRKEILMHINNPKMATLLVWGAPGIGKTAILEAAAKEIRKQEGKKDFSLIVKSLANETPDNFTLPKYVEDEKGQEFATDVPKTWLPVYKPTENKKVNAERDAACGQGLLFVDELSRATPQVQNVILPLVNEKQFNGYVLGSGWSIICASNRAEDEESGQTNLGNAMANRFDQVWYEPTVHSWENWAKNQDFISPLLLSWLNMPASENMSGAKYFYYDPNEDNAMDNPSTLMCTPRAWTNAMRKLAVYANQGKLEGFDILDIPDRVIGRCLNSSIPAVAIDAFLGFLAVIRKVGSIDKIAKDIWSGKKPNIDKRNLMQIALPLAQLLVTYHKDTLPTQKEFENLGNYIASTGNDALASYALDIFKHVFFGQIDNEKNMALGFIFHGKMAKVQKEGPKAMINFLEKTMDPIFSRYGVTSETFPDYRTGLKVFRDAFGETFRNTKLEDFEDVLG